MKMAVKGLLSLFFAASAAVASADIPVKDIVTASQQIWKGSTSFEVSGQPGTSTLSMLVWVADEKGSGGEWVPTETLVMQSPMIVKANLTFNSQVLGVPGLIFIGAYQDGKGTAYMTSQGWSAFEGGMMPPYAIASSGMPGSMTVTLINRQAPCSVYSEGGDVYAGYGLMTPRNTNLLQTFLRTNVRHTPEHLAHAVLSNDAQVNNRYWKIFSMPKCGSKGEK